MCRIQRVPPPPPPPRCTIDRRGVSGGRGVAKNALSERFYPRRTRTTAVRRRRQCAPCALYIRRKALFAFSPTSSSSRSRGLRSPRAFSHVSFKSLPNFSRIPYTAYRTIKPNQTQLQRRRGGSRQESISYLVIEQSPTNVSAQDPGKTNSKLFPSALQPRILVEFSK